MTFFGLKDFKFTFSMKTLNHNYDLFAETQSAKDLWMNGFQYIIVSNMQAKNLIRQSIKDEKIIAEQRKRYNSMSMCT